jgi:hypothetical protein
MIIRSCQPVEKVSLLAVCHAEFISASRKINKLGDPETSSG